MSALLTPQQAAESLGVTLSAVYSQIHNGVITAAYDGRRRILTADEVERYRREHLGNHSRSIPVEPRLWARVDKNGPIPPHCPELGPCWVWTGKRDKKGYGKIWIDGKECLVHRVAYAMEHGALSDDLLVCHHCDNPPCVNPSHHFLGTMRQNMDDMRAKNRHAQGERMGSATLSAEEVREIYALSHASSLTQYEIADQYGIDQSTVSMIHNRKTRSIDLPDAIEVTMQAVTR